MDILVKLCSDGKVYMMRVDRLRQVRELRQLSQKDLGERVGTSDKQIYRYENGTNEPTADILTRIAQALEVSADYLLGMVDSPTDHVREEDLSPMERRLIQAYRKGLIVEALKVLTTAPESVDKPGIPPTEIAVNS